MYNNVQPYISLQRTLVLYEPKQDNQCHVWETIGVKSIKGFRSEKMLTGSCQGSIKKVLGAISVPERGVTITFYLSRGC